MDNDCLLLEAAVMFKAEIQATPEVNDGGALLEWEEITVSRQEEPAQTMAT